jgi:nitrogen fixation/metabolism regulation signal transduction histidine kinase
MQSLKQALSEDHTRSVLLGNALSVIAPIKSNSKNLVGAALVRIPTERMWQAVQSQLKTAMIIALGVLGTGFVLSLLLAKHQVAPIEALTAAATSVEARKFEPTALAAVTSRPDELGRLARVFSSMGQTVVAREEKLDTLVQDESACRTDRATRNALDPSCPNIWPRRCTRRFSKAGSR